MYIFINPSVREWKNFHPISIKNWEKVKRISSAQFDNDKERMMEWARNEAKKETELYNQKNGKVSVDFPKELVS